MSAPGILYIDTTNKRLITSFLSTINPLSALVWEAGDLVPLQLHFLQANPSSGTLGQLPYSYIDPSTLLPVSLALGSIGQLPTAGTFTVTYGANTTTALAFNITAAALSTALNLLASVTSAGGVTVTGNAGGPYRITFTTPGVISTVFSVNAGELSPTSQGIVAIAVTGSTGVNEVQVITLLQNPAALLTSWTATYGAISVTQLQAGGSGLNSIQRITVPQGTYAGAFSLSWAASGSPPSTGAIPYNATAAQVQTAFSALAGVGAAQVAVVLSSPTTWDITFQGTLAGLAQPAIVASGTGLMMPQYLAGNLNLNVQGIFDFLDEAASGTPTLQIQQGSPGSVNTVLQQTIALNNTIIVGTPAAPTPVPGSVWGATAIPSGNDVVAVTFPFALANPPSAIVFGIGMPSGTGASLSGNYDKSSVTTTGFNFILDSVPAVTGSVLGWMTLP